MNKPEYLQTRNTILLLAHVTKDLGSLDQFVVAAAGEADVKALAVALKPFYEAAKGMTVAPVVGPLR